MEIFDPVKPKKGWKQMAQLTMPVAVSEHCTVTMDGRHGKEVVVVGGKGRERRAMKLNIRSKKYNYQRVELNYLYMFRWYSLNRLNTGRNNHACAKVNMCHMCLVWPRHLTSGHHEWPPRHCSVWRIKYQRD